MSAPTRKPSSSRKVRRISSTELSKHLASVLTRVCERNETVIVERNGKPLCQVVPIGERDQFTVPDLARLLTAIGPLGRDWADAFADHVANQEPFEPRRWRH